MEAFISGLNPLLALFLIAALGYLIGAIKIKGIELGTAGVLLVALVFGHFGHIGPIDLTLDKPSLVTFRELGLMLFLIGAGTDGGAGFVDTLRQEGAILFVYGAVMTILPMIVGYFVAAKALKLSLLNNLGSITGGMTSTPALGTLIHVAGTSNVASAYAATYPIALIAVVLVSQLLVRLF